MKEYDRFHKEALLKVAKKFFKSSYRKIEIKEETLVFYKQSSWIARKFEGDDQAVVTVSFTDFVLFMLPEKWCKFTKGDVSPHNVQDTAKALFATLYTDITSLTTYLEETIKKIDAKKAAKKANKDDIGEKKRQIVNMTIGHQNSVEIPTEIAEEMNAKVLLNALIKHDPRILDEFLAHKSQEEGGTIEEIVTAQHVNVTK